MRTSITRNRSRDVVGWNLSKIGLVFYIEWFRSIMEHKKERETERKRDRKTNTQRDTKKKNNYTTKQLFATFIKFYLFNINKINYNLRLENL